MKEETFQKLADAAFNGKTGVDQAVIDETIRDLAGTLSTETEVALDNGLYVNGKLDTDNGGVLVQMKIPAQRIRWQHFVPCEVAEPVAGELKDDGPTVEEYVKAGYRAKNYPPKGYASKSSDEEIAAAIASQGDSADDAEQDDSKRTIVNAAGIEQSLPQSKDMTGIDQSGGAGTTLTRAQGGNASDGNQDVTALIEREKAGDSLTDEERASLVAWRAEHPDSL